MKVLKTIYIFGFLAAILTITILAENDLFYGNYLWIMWGSLAYIGFFGIREILKSR